jgi:antitoxin Phd
MKSINLREAKARLSALVEAAERGEATIVTKHGRPAAAVVPAEDARRLYPEDRPSFAKLLTSIPHDIEIERPSDPVRDIAL